MNFAKFFKLVFIFLSVVAIEFVAAGGVKAQENTVSCQNRFVTFVNPVRSRELWADKSLSPMENQYQDLKKYSFPATWLLQYDTFGDKDLVDKILTFDRNQEVGVFLEISRQLADDTGVPFPGGVGWSDPGTVFLSAYAQSERRSLIDNILQKYKRVFGKFPKSVGAWWIDSYSLNYLVEKYGVTTALIVADQKVTDSYGVWGQWWGFPYRPSKASILVPASNTDNAQKAVVIQWAQRHPTLAYGGQGNYSGFSLQSNDYIHVGRGTDFFKDLVLQYLNCRNSLAQITIGLETGQESLSQPEEYKRQLQFLSSIKGLQPVTMSDFANFHFRAYKINPDKIYFGENNSNWEMTVNYRRNEKLGDYIPYNQKISFKDYFLRDNASFLNRVMPVNNTPSGYIPWFLPAGIILLIAAIRSKKFYLWVAATFTTFALFGLLFRSNSKFGWQVFYGPVVNNLELVQLLILVIIFCLFLTLGRKLRVRLLLLLIPLSFGFDRIVSVLRFSNIPGERFFGVALGTSRFIGLKIGRAGLSFINIVFEPIRFQSLVKFDFTIVWKSSLLYFIAYPIAHLFVALVLWLVIRKSSRKVKILVFLILFLLFVCQIVYIFNSDPMYAKAVGLLTTK